VIKRTIAGAVCGWLVEVVVNLWATSSQGQKGVSMSVGIGLLRPFQGQLKEGAKAVEGRWKQRGTKQSK